MLSFFILWVAYQNKDIPNQEETKEGLRFFWKNQVWQNVQNAENRCCLTLFVGIADTIKGPK